jgi:hypothetical protein
MKTGQKRCAVAAGCPTIRCESGAGVSRQLSRAGLEELEHRVVTDTIDIVLRILYVSVAVLKNHGHDNPSIPGAEFLQFLYT